MTSSTEIVQQRIINQHLSEPLFKTANEIVRWMGALQAQDYAMAKWAIGVRLPGTTEKQVEDVLTKGEIVRTHVLRPTWHFASSEDVHWMLDLTANRIRATLKSYQAKLGLDQKLFTRTNLIIEKLLSNNNFLTRSEIVVEFKRKKIFLNNFQAMHVMFEAELTGLVCNGPLRGKQFTYALMDERIPKPKPLLKEEALFKLASRYFSSHGPATSKDFTWWSGLAPTDAQEAIELVKNKFTCTKIGKNSYWFSSTGYKPSSAKALCLPAFDEFTIAYADRSDSLEERHAKKALVGYGIFKPIIVMEGKVIGIWRRTIQKNQVIIKPHFFGKKMKLKKGEMKKAAEPYGKYLNLPVKIQMR